MRKLTASFLENQAFIEWNERARRAREELLIRVAGGENPSDCFKEKIWQDFKKKFLIKEGRGKCVFCEGRYVAGSPGDCEHFRPKGAVTENRKRLGNHFGYYWLAYDWNNLLLACRNCNSAHVQNYQTGDTHPGKLNEFPVNGRRIAQPCADCQEWWDELTREEPLLLHPYFDEPEKHFKAGEDGVLIGSTERGRKTIEICDLNRSELIADRERELLRMEERLGSVVARRATAIWFTVDEPFSLYLNLLLKARAEESLRKFSLVPGAE